MQADSNTPPGAGPSHNPLKSPRKRVLPRVVTTGSLTSHVYFQAGPTGSSGPTFVLLHGIGMSHRYYRKLHAVLAEHGDTLAIDLPGFGGTPTPDGQLSIADYAVHTAATLEKMGVTRAVLVGHSMGTQFATELAVRRPDLASHVVLLGPVVDPERRTVLQQSFSLGLDSLMESPAGNAIVIGDYARSGLRWYLTELPVMMSYDLQLRLALVEHPVLVVRGSRDPVAPRLWCEKLAATAPKGRFLEIPRKPHIVQHGAAARTAAGIIALTTNN